MADRRSQVRGDLGGVQARDRAAPPPPRGRRRCSRATEAEDGRSAAGSAAAEPRLRFLAKPGRDLLGRSEKSGPCPGPSASLGVNLSEAESRDPGQEKKIWAPAFAGEQSIGDLHARGSASLCRPGAVGARSSPPVPRLGPRAGAPRRIERAGRGPVALERSQGGAG